MTEKFAYADKELIEDSTDAKATEISIKMSDTCLNSLQVHDNGCMIGNDDLKIVAERFVTSKAKSMDDFKKMQTYVFRGEALASKGVNLV
uniref:NifU_N domain-containing protein n=1 Tax=Strongyloides papillosus TaxID=174720 RepID=A0A0N5C1W3_STREA